MYTRAICIQLQDLNQQLDHAESEIKLEQEKRAGAEEDVANLRDQLAGVKTALSLQVMELDQQLTGCREQCSQLQTEKVSPVASFLSLYVCVCMHVHVVCTYTTSNKIVAVHSQDSMRLACANAVVAVHCNYYVHVHLNIHCMAYKGSCTCMCSSCEEFNFVAEKEHIHVHVSVHVSWKCSYVLMS